MNILVTGAGGLVGSRIAVDLADEGHQVTGVWRSDRSRLKALESKAVALRQADLCDQLETVKLFQPASYDVVIHAAAAIVPENSADALRIVAEENVRATTNVVSAATAEQRPLFIFLSSISVYGSNGAPKDGFVEAQSTPDSYYGWSKRASEILLDVTSMSCGLASVSFRLAGVHGGGRTSGALAKFAREALKGEPIHLSEPGSRFRWAFMDDVSQAISLCCATELPKQHTILNLASGDSFSLAELTDQLCKLTNSNSVISRSNGLARNEIMNIDRIQRVIDFKPTLLRDYLQKYLPSLGKE